ncbi:MAG: SprT family zinc-dependent metalloprotease [Ignavibacteriales bacterium]|nr:SprT family zinc-dependent metalloprotease [Ignavibacteriales bacterium]
MNIEKQQIKLGDISIDVIYKNIKNIHLSVHPPTGRVRIASPTRFKLDSLRVYAISKLNWIKKQQHKIQSQDREAPREYITRETHYYLGKRFLLNVIITNSTPKIILNHSTIELHVRENSTLLQRKTLMNEWYRESLKEIIPEYIERWEKILNVKVNEYGIKKMKTRWGTCNIKDQRIWINLELAKKPIQCLEYIIVHEMIHLIERTHNERFLALMKKFLPQWKLYKEELNRFPLNHEEWDY